MGKVQPINEMINETFSKRKFNDHCSLKSMRLCSDAEAEAGADRLIEKLDAPECRLFFIKVMYYIPYDERERLLNIAVRPCIKSPKKYFTFSAKRALARLGH